jgi:hypothetical protein
MPDNKFIIVPAVSIKLVKRNFAFYMGFEYFNSDFYRIWPVWCRAGISYNFDLKHLKTPLKMIKWY